MSSGLRVEALQSGYGKLPVVHDASLACGEKEIVAVVGPNGAGKSTLMKAIFGLLPAFGGRVLFGADDVTGAACKDLVARGMALVPQDGNTFPGLSVEDNLAIGLSGRANMDRQGRIDEVFRMFPGIAERREQRASTLSGGERQMLAIAGAWVSQPRLLGLDEPITGLAPAIVEDLIARIKGFRDRGTAILWVVEEDPLRILPHVDRVYLMQAGVIAREMSAAEVVESDSLVEMMFGEADRAPMESFVSTET